VTQSAQVVGDLSPNEFRTMLESSGIGVRIGPFDAHIVADIDGLHESLHTLYHDYQLLDLQSVFNFHANLKKRRKFTIVGPQLVRFTVDGRAPHEDMPAEHALAVLEWGINLVIALRSHSLLMMHSAVLERGGKAMLLPAMPGDGKTTLCAGLMHRGWRLFSDEFGLMRLDSEALIPIPRPMPLKNESIQVIRAFAPDAVFGPTILNTRKGTIAHVRPPAASLQQAKIGAPPAWVVFPRWVDKAQLVIEEIPKAEAFMWLASNSFNYEYLGEPAFRAVRRIVEGARCFHMIYSDLEEATSALSDLADG
jgi:HprK-related kinase A